MAAKFYGVKQGRTPGIYTSWEDCKAQVQGFSGAVYKSFPTAMEAAEYVFGPSEKKQTEDAAFLDKADNSTAIHMDADIDIDADTDIDTAVAYVDGSYNIQTGVYGYGLHLTYQGKVYEQKGVGDNLEKASMRNVAGEIDGAMAAVSLAISCKAPKILIYYDYMGIEQWAVGGWKTNKPWTKEYADFMRSSMGKIDIFFVKVPAHTGIEGNERVDRLAKEAVGIA